MAKRGRKPKCKETRIIMEEHNVTIDSDVVYGSYFISKDKECIYIGKTDCGSEVIKPSTAIKINVNDLDNFCIELKQVAELFTNYKAMGDK